MNIMILTEGGSDIGFGHITRCLSLCQAFEEEGMRPEFILNADVSVKALVKGKRYQIFDWLKQGRRLRVILNGCDIAIIDSYMAHKSVYKKISRVVNTAVYIDDNNRIEYPEGIVINGAIGAQRISYPRRADIKYLLGIKYAMLRKCFWKIPKKKIKKNPAGIMITFGGCDTRGMTVKILGLVRGLYPKMTKYIVIGKAFTDIGRIKNMADKDTKLVYSADGAKMKNLMLKADMAISAGGQTMYELARAGLASVIIGVADNQTAEIKAWRRTGFIEHAGWWLDKGLLAKTLISLKKIEPCRSRLHKYKIGRRFVDGGGSRRIVDFLMRRVSG